MNDGDFDEAGRREAVALHLDSWGFTGTPAEGRGTPFSRALLAIADAAAQPNTADNRPVAARVGEAFRFADNMKLAGHSGVADLAAADFWQHLREPIAAIKSDEAPQLQRDEVEMLVGEYLALSYRSQRIDRLLVDMLIAQELLAYGGPVVNSPKFPGIETPYSALTVRPMRKLLAGIAVDLAVAVVVGGVLVWLSSVGVFPAGWLLPSLLLIVVLGVLTTIWTLVRYPAYAKNVRDRQSSISTPLRAMVDVYLSLESAGPLSAIHTLRKVEDAERTSGVGWPSSIYPLLNDILSRGDRF